MSDDTESELEKIKRLSGVRLTTQDAEELGLKGIGGVRHLRGGFVFNAWGEEVPIPPIPSVSNFENNVVYGLANPTIKVLGEGRLPVQAHKGDAGFDLFCSESVWVPPGEVMEIACGIDVQPPEGHWLFLVGRSSTFDRGLVVNPTVIDSGYRGRLSVLVRNVGDEPVRVETGERLAQVVPIGLVSDTIRVERVESLDPSERGSNGFGSTGR